MRSGNDVNVGGGRSREILGDRVDWTRLLRGRTCGQGWDRGRGSVQILEVRFWCQEKIVGRARQHACGSVHVRRGFAVRNGLKGGGAPSPPPPSPPVPGQCSRKVSRAGRRGGVSGGGRAGGVLCGVGRRRGGQLGSRRARDRAETGGDRMVRGDSGGDHDLPRRVAKRIAAA